MQELNVPCHAFPVITRPLVCYVAFSACKRPAESQTLKVHPVTNTENTCLCCPRTPRWRFFFFFLVPSDVTTTKWTNPWGSSHTHTHTHSALSFLSHATPRSFAGTHTHSALSFLRLRVCGEQPGCECMRVLRLSSAVSRCLADPTQQPGNDTSNPAHTVRSSSLKGRSSEPRNVPPIRHPDPRSILICLSLLVSFSGC